MSCGSMDKRCPLQLEKLPERFCALAVQRLKAIRFAGHDLSEDEEAKLKGCPYAVMHQMSNYCLFKYLADYSSNKRLSETEVARLCNISVDQVKDISKHAFHKIKNSQEFLEVKEEYSGHQILDDKRSGDTYSFD